MPLGVPFSVNTDLAMYFDLDADLQAFTDGVAIGTVAEAADTGLGYIWNGTTWKSLGGATVYSGNGAPSSSLGVNGDIYIDFDTGNFYEKVSGAWVVQGDISPTIPPDTWLYGSTTALTSQGNNTNFYSEYVNNRVYQKGSTTSTIAATNRIAESTSSTPNAFQTTSAITAISGRLYMAYVWTATAAGVSPQILSITGGPNWSLAKTAITVLSSRLCRCSVYSAMSTSTLAGATLGVAATNGQATAVHVTEFTGIDTSGTDGSGAIVQTASRTTDFGASLSPTLSAFGDSANNAALVGYAHATAEATTQDTSFTELTDATTAGATGWGFETSWLLGQDTSPTGTWATSSAGVAVAVELKAATNSATWNRLVPGLPTYKSNFDIVSTSATTNLLSQSIPAGLLETTSGILIIIEGDYLNSSGASRGITMQIVFGGTTMWGDASGNIIATLATRRGFYSQFFLRNEASASAQRVAGQVLVAANTTGSVAGTGSLGTASLAINSVVSGTAAVDTTSAQTLAITFAHSANAATIELRGALTVVVIP